MTGLELLVIKLVIDAILSGQNATVEQIVKAVEFSSEYKGKLRGKALSNKVTQILKKEDVRSAIKAETSDENSISLDFKKGRFEGGIKFNLD